MKRDGILIGAKPVAFFGESHCSNTKAVLGRTPLGDLTQKVGIVEQVWGPIETHRLFHLRHVAQVQACRLQLAAQAYIISIRQDNELLDCVHRTYPPCDTSFLMLRCCAAPHLPSAAMLASHSAIRPSSRAASVLCCVLSSVRRCHSVSLCAS